MKKAGNCGGDHRGPGFWEESSVTSRLIRRQIGPREQPIWEEAEQRKKNSKNLWLNTVTTGENIDQVTKDKKTQYFLGKRLIVRGGQEKTGTKKKQKSLTCLLSKKRKYIPLWEWKILNEARGRTSRDGSLGAGGVWRSGAGVSNWQEEEKSFLMMGKNAEKFLVLVKRLNKIRTLTRS